MQYGYTGPISTSWRSQNASDAATLAQAMATQVLIWETVVGERDEDFNHISPGSYDAVKSVVSTAHPLYLQAVVILFGGFCRLSLFIGRYFILCLADIFPCFLDRLLTLLVELVDTLVLDTVSPVGKPVSGIFRSRVFISIAALFRLILCFRISGLHTLGSNGGFVYGLYCAFDRISGFYISH